MHSRFYTDCLRFVEGQLSNSTIKRTSTVEFRFSDSKFKGIIQMDKSGYLSNT